MAGWHWGPPSRSTALPGWPVAHRSHGRMPRMPSTRPRRTSGPRDAIVGWLKFSVTWHWPFVPLRGYRAPLVKFTRKTEDWLLQPPVQFVAELPSLAPFIRKTPVVSSGSRSVSGNLCRLRKRQKNQSMTTADRKSAEFSPTICVAHALKTSRFWKSLPREKSGLVGRRPRRPIGLLGCLGTTLAWRFRRTNRLSRAYRTAPRYCAISCRSDSRR